MQDIHFEINSRTGYIKLYRSLTNKGWYNRPSYVHLWIHLLLSASHSGMECIFNGKTRTLIPGQLITGRKSISEKTGIPESTVRRILNWFESEHQIIQETTYQNRVITICNWDLYQAVNRDVEQQTDNKRTTNGRQMDINNNVNNVNNEIRKIVEYLNKQTNKSFKSNATKTIRCISARLKEGYKLEDIEKVIDLKTKEWKNTKMNKFLRPETLFGPKFESYFNEKPVNDENNNNRYNAGNKDHADERL